QIRPAVLDQRRPAPRVEPGAKDDAVRETVGLRGPRPEAEGRIAAEADLAIRDVSADRVWAGGGERGARLAARGPGRHQVGVREREREQELRLGDAEVERHRVLAVVGDDARGEIAPGPARAGG